MNVVPLINPVVVKARREVRKCSLHVEALDMLLFGQEDPDDKTLVQELLDEAFGAQEAAESKLMSLLSNCEHRRIDAEKAAEVEALLAWANEDH